MDRNTITAAVVLTVILACALVPVAEAADVSEYTIDMRVGDTFTYSPTTTLPASFDSAPDIEGVSWDANKRTMTASFDQAKPQGVQVLIMAHWTSSDGSISQDAKQAITFRVFNHVSMECDSSAAVPVGTVAGSTILKPAISEADEGTETVVTCDLKDNPHIQWDSSKNAIVTKAAITSADSAEYSFAITATNASTDEDSTLRAETATVNVRISVGSSLTIIDSDMETYIGCTDSRNTWTMKTNMDASGVEIVKTITAPADAPEGLVVSNENGTLVVDPSKAVLGAASSKTYTFTAKATAIIDGETVEATRTFEVVVWKDLTYLTIPTLSDVQLVADSSDARKVTLSASVTRASAVTVDWGDGNAPVRVDPDDGKITAANTYSDKGRHVIAVTAVNGSGEGVVHYVLYDASTGYFEDYKPVEKEETSFPVWLIFLVLAGVFAAMYLVFGFRIPIILIGGIASAILAAVFYCGWL